MAQERHSHESHQATRTNNVGWNVGPPAVSPDHRADGGAQSSASANDDQHGRHSLFLVESQTLALLWTKYSIHYFHNFVNLQSSNFS